MSAQPWEGPLNRVPQLPHLSDGNNNCTYTSGLSRDYIHESTWNCSLCIVQFRSVDQSCPTLPHICLLIFICSTHGAARMLSRFSCIWTLCDHSSSGSSVLGIFPARLLEWVAMPSSQGSSWPGIEPTSPALQEDSLPLSQQGSPYSPQNF